MKIQCCNVGHQGLTEILTRRSCFSISSVVHLVSVCQLAHEAHREATATREVEVIVTARRLEQNVQ